MAADGLDVIIFDPLYKVFSAGTDENAAGDLADLMRVFDEIAEATGAAVAIVHHEAKSRAAKLINRGSGSGLLGRDCDAAIYLEPHFADQDAVVVETITRNYPPRKTLCAKFESGAFEMATDLATIPQNEAPISRRTGSDFDSIIKSTCQGITEPVPVNRVLFDLQSKYDIGQNRARDVVALLIAENGFSRTHATKGKAAMLCPPDCQDAPLHGP